MRRRARALVGLKHEVGPAVSLRHSDIGGYVGRLYVFKRTLAGATVCAAQAIHPALIGVGVQVAHLIETGMAMVRIVGTSERNLCEGNRLPKAIDPEVL